MKFNIPIGGADGEQFLNNSESSKFGELKFRNFGRLLLPASGEGGEKLLEKVTVEESSCSSGRHKGARFSGLSVQQLASLYSSNLAIQYLAKEFSIGDGATY